MFKKLLSILAGLLVAVSAYGEVGPDIVQFASASCQTNTAATVTNSPVTDGFLSGWIDSIVVDQTGTATGTVSLATLAGGGGVGISRSILLDVTVSADGVYPVRDLATTQAGADITGEGEKIFLLQDKLRLTLYNFGATNTSAVVYVIMSDKP